MKQFEWGFGRNVNGELALGVLKNAHVPACALGLANGSTKQIASSVNHTVLVTTGGDVFCAGSRINGKTGQKTNTKNITDFQLVQSLSSKYRVT